MAFRKISVGGSLALALTLAACGGEQPAADEPAAVSAPDAAAAVAVGETPAPEASASAAPAAEASPADDADKPAEPDKAAAVTAPAKPAVAAAAPVAEVVKVAATVAPPAAFGRCAVCHTADKGGEDKLGPNLYGVYGKAAGRGSFSFSSELKAAGLVLDEATLHKWLENPRALVPGNRMSFPGIKDAAKRQDIIDYLKQQS